LFLIYNQKHYYASLLNKFHKVFACAHTAESCWLYMNKHEAKGTYFGNCAALAAAFLLV